MAQATGNSYGYAWTGEAYQETQSGTTISIVLIFAIIMTILVLAAQYESWTDPLAVVIAMPTALHQHLHTNRHYPFAGARRQECNPHSGICNRLPQKRDAYPRSGTPGRHSAFPSHNDDCLGICFRCNADAVCHGGGSRKPSKPRNSRCLRNGRKCNHRNPFRTEFLGNLPKIPGKISFKALCRLLLAFSSPRATKTASRQIG